MIEYRFPQPSCQYKTLQRPVEIRRLLNHRMGRKFIVYNLPTNNLYQQSNAVYLRVPKSFGKGKPNLYKCTTSEEQETF
jgi:hypothetical protein